MTTTTRIAVAHSGDGTTAETSRDDTTAHAALKAAGFRWGRSIAAWYLPRPWSVQQRAGRVRQLLAALPAGAVAVDDRGAAATTTAAEREAATADRATARAERLDARAEQLHTESDRRAEAARRLGDGIPFGQPILVGHHSEARHRRDLARIHAHDAAAWDAQKKAQQAEHRADTARATAAGPTPRARLRRIERNEAEVRRIGRELDRLDVLAAMSDEQLAARYWRRPSAEYRAGLEATRDRLADEIAHDRAQVDAAGVRQYTPADIRKGDRVRYRGCWRVVVRVNRTTVSVETGYSWIDRVEIHQVTGVERGGQLVEPGAGH